MLELIKYISQHPIMHIVPPFVRNALITYFIFKFLDFGSGLLKTLKPQTEEDKFKSRKMHNGLMRWAGELMAIVFVITVDWLFGLKYALTIITLLLFIYKEGGSIDENLRAIGVNIPSTVMEKLKYLVEGFVNTAEKKVDKK